MTNQIRLIGVICLFTALIVSCKKEKHDYNPDDPCSLISRITEEGTGHTWAFTYDEQRRVKTVKYPYVNPLTYTYYKDSIVQSGKDKFGTDIGMTYYLDANGHITKTSRYDNEYIYNAEGYLVSVRKSGNTAFTLTYENGDLVEILTGSGREKWSFKYFNEANQCLFNFNQPLVEGGVLGLTNVYLMSAGFFGKLSTHLYRSYGYNDQWVDGDLIHYAKDGKGRISAIDDYNVTYECD